MNSYTILLIDDEPDILDVLSVNLTDAGYQVITASDGKTGLELCHSQHPQIVVTDIRMPEMTGIQVLENIKQKFPDKEVIVTTAYGDIDTAIRALQLDASDFITKPINDTALHLALKRAKDRYEARKKLADYTALLEKEHAETSMQAKILHQDKMMSLGRLAASIVHEINNPLAGILNYLRLMIKIMAQQPVLNPEQKVKFQQYLTIIEQETTRCSHIVSGLLAFSRKSEPSFGPVQLEELLDRSRLLSQHKLKLSNIELEIIVEKDVPVIYGDFNQLHQCIINLIFNAIDAMPQGGIIQIRASYDQQKTMIAIQVKDTGSGILPEHLPHIFEPFFTTKQEGYGVGIGLSTVYGIIERHKGTIQVKSQVGVGTSFFIDLPVS